MTKIALPLIYPVACHTDHIGPGSIFVAIKGLKQDGVAYIQQALKKGATTIIVDQYVELAPKVLQHIYAAGALVEKVSDTRAALAQLSAKFAGFPARKLKIIGITGTKGKTTTAYLIEHILKNVGYKTSLLSTVKNSILNNDFKTNLTTRQPDYLHQFFKLCVTASVQYVVMEVAAQALTLHRVDGLQFDGVIFTNFSQEHAEFYTSLEEYFTAKCLIFDQVKVGAPCLVNGDDEWCRRIEDSFHSTSSQSSRKDLAGTAGRMDLEITLKKIKKISWFGFDFSSVHHELVEGCRTENKIEWDCPALFGHFNTYNIVAAAELCKKLNVSEVKIQHVLQTFSGVPGRLESYKLPNGAQFFIDYAHNPASYQAVLSALRKMTSHLIVVFGAGGERDTTKRSLMGAVAQSLADVIILTTDNPRSEDPQDIITDIISGISQKHYHKIIKELDRAKAIKKAFEVSTPKSIMVVLGKGPDCYQEIKGVKTYFSDSQEVKKLQVDG